MRFFAPPDEKKIVVHSFDLSGANVGVNTAFRENIPVKSSGQNEWKKSAVELNENETGGICAIRFEGGREMPNDGTFYVTDGQGRPLPIFVPVYHHVENKRAIPKLDVEYLPECNTVMLDASKSSDPEGDELSYAWDFGDGQSGTGVRISHEYGKPGTYLASLVVNEASGQVFNSVLRQFKIRINHPPIARAGEDLVVAPGEKTVFDSSKSEDPDGKIRGRFWDFGDGKTAKGRTVKHAYKKPGRYTAVLRVEDNTGTPCGTGTDEREIVVNAGPDVKTGGDKIASPNETVSFSAEGSVDRDGQIIEYKWNFGDGNAGQGMNVEHVYKKPGVYKVTLTATDDSGTKNSKAAASLKVFVNDRPVAKAGPDRRASVGEKIVFDASRSRDRDGRIIEYAWDFGDGESKSTGESKIEHAYERPGTYNVILNVKDDSKSTSSGAQDEVRVFVNDPPLADAGPDRHTTECEVRFDGSESKDADGKIIRYVWEFGDGTRSEEKSPVHVYRSPGVYTVRLTVTDDSKTSSNTSKDEAAVTVNHLPIADAGPDRVGVPGLPIDFDGSASLDPDGKIASFEWDFGDGSFQIGNKVSHAYGKSGVYDVLLTVHDDSGDQAALSYDHARVSVNTPPVADAGRDLVAAPGQQIVFNGSASHDPDGKIEKYEWRFSDSEDKSFKTAEVRRSFEKPGTYTATLNVTDDSGLENSTSQDKTVIRINHRPSANAGRNIHTNERTVYLDGSASSDADGDPLVFTWDFGDGTPKQNGESVYHTYETGGSFPVILNVDDGRGLSNSTSVSSVSVKIDDPPVADAGNVRNACAGKVVIFDASGSVDPEGGLMKYSWDFGDGTSAEGVNPTKTYTKGGVYQVRLTVADDSGLEGNTSLDEIMVEVAESPVSDAGPDQTSCAGTTVQFDGTRSVDLDGLVNSYRWDFGDGTMGGGPTPVHAYKRAGVYRVVLMITGDQIGNCDNTDTDEMMVTIHEAPVVELECPAMSEPGKPVQFRASIDQDSLVAGVSNVQLKWDFGGGTKTGETVEHTYQKPGKYFVTLTAISDSETRCNTNVLKKKIIVNAPPIAGIKIDPDERYMFGVNQVVTFDGSASEDPDGAISFYRWDFGDGGSGEGAQAWHRYKTPGRYKVVLRASDNTNLANNTSEATLTVTVNAPPKPVFSLKKPPCAGEQAFFSAEGSVDPDGKISAYTWNFGDGSPDQNGREATHVFENPGKYPVVLTVDDGNGVSNSKAQASTVISVNASPKADAGSDRVVSPGEEVVFDASASYDPDGSIETHSWDFGDNTETQAEKTSHTYTVPGTYNVTLTVVDNSGSECGVVTDKALIRVNSPPVAEAGDDRKGFTGGANDAVFFDAGASHDPDGDTLTYHWDFGDGSTAGGPRVSHTYGSPGKYSVTLRVDDGSGLKSGIDEAGLTVIIEHRE